MKHNTALTLSGILTAFVLVVIGGVVVTVYGSGQNNPALSAAPDIAQTNLQPSQQAGENQVLSSGQQQTPVSIASQVPVDAATALATAESVAGNKVVLMGVPQLVSLEGKTAYEVSFNQGMIYVDANSGQVLFNGIKPQQIVQPQVVQQVDVQLAGQIAANYMGENDIATVELVNYTSNSMAYRVTFQSGNIVFVDMTGQVISYQLYDPTYSNGGENEGGGGSDD